MAQITGGGSKKVLYTLNTVRRIGLKNSAKALTSKNTCKACGLGMGGQRGGMTDELGEFPAVCNKSVQAQSTDIQPPIPAEIFEHSIAELRELSARELEHLGRLGNPVHKAPGSGRYREVGWDWALERAAARLRETDPLRTFFYSSGRASNESGFLLQLFARLYGTNSVNNCSYYCHQATSVALGATIGTGTATVELDDLQDCDLIFVIGANPASNHPRFIYQLKACRERGGQVIVINPAKEPGLVKFSLPKSARSMLGGGTEIASLYLQPKIGGDIALFKGIAKAVLERREHDRAFIERYTEGFDVFQNDIADTGWETIEARCGLNRADIERAAGLYAGSANAVFAWGMGMTHHAFGCENVEYIAGLALMRGMVGKRGAGLLPLRGHSNVQGIGTIGVKPVLPADVYEKLQSELNVTLPENKGYDTLAGLEAAHAGDVDLACIVGGNLYGATPNSRWSAQALNRIPFKLFLTTTLNRGHVNGVDGGEAIILPVAARDEEPQATTQESMFNYVRLSDGGIERLANVRSEVAVISSLAKRVLPDHPIDFTAFGDHEQIRQTIARVIPGMQDLEDIGVAKREFHVRGRLLHAPEFKTPGGRAVFRVHAIPDEINHSEAFPFTLATVRSEGQFNTMIYEEADVYRNNAPRWSVMMNPEDMREKNLQAGDKVTLRSANGVMQSVTVHPFDLPRNNLLAYFPEANVLTGRTVDPRSRTPNFKSIAVTIDAELL